MMLIALAVLLPALALCQVDIDSLANYEFNRFDGDQDGNIEPLEVQQYFARFDANHDQRISRQEYQHEVETHHVNNPAAHDVLLKLFDALDYDNDNHLDDPDYTRLFRSADVNNNNLVSQREFVTYFHDLTGSPVVG